MPICDPREWQNLSKRAAPVGFVPEYDREYPVDCDHPQCHIYVRLAKDRGRLRRFAIQLQKYQELTPKWETIAQFDHDPGADMGHDVFSEGLHIDLYLEYASDMKVYPSHPPLRDFSPGAVVRRCVDYFKEHDEWFLNVHRGLVAPDDPPHW